MPAQFIKTPVFGIRFPFDDPLVFVRSDCPFGLVFDFGPKPFGNDRPCQPVHGDAEVMQLTQMNIRADRPRLQAGEKLLRLRLDNDQRKNQIKCLLFDGALPALFG